MFSTENECKWELMHNSASLVVSFNSYRIRKGPNNKYPTNIQKYRLPKNLLHIYPTRIIHSIMSLNWQYLCIIIDKASSVWTKCCSWLYIFDEVPWIALLEKISPINMTIICLKQQGFYIMIILVGYDSLHFYPHKWLQFCNRLFSSQL